MVFPLFCSTLLIEQPKFYINSINQRNVAQYSSYNQHFSLWKSRLFVDLFTSQLRCEIYITSYNIWDQIRKWHLHWGNYLFFFFLSQRKLHVLLIWDETTAEIFLQSLSAYSPIPYSSYRDVIVLYHQPALWNWYCLYIVYTDFCKKILCNI